MVDYKHSRHSVFSLNVHLIFVVKRRGKAFNEERLAFLKDVFDGVCEEFESELLEFNGEADHVHLLVSHPPKHSVSALVNSLKGVSSRMLKLQFPEIEHFWSVRKSRGALWSPSFFACSVGGAPIDVLKRYIQQQGSTPA
jgi:putative transposase